MLLVKLEPSTTFYTFFSRTETYYCLATVAQYSYISSRGSSIEHIGRGNEILYFTTFTNRCAFIK